MILIHDVENSTCPAVLLYYWQVYFGYADNKIYLFKLWFVLYLYTDLKHPGLLKSEEILLRS